MLLARLSSKIFLSSSPRTVRVGDGLLDARNDEGDVGDGVREGPGLGGVTGLESFDRTKGLVIARSILSFGGGDWELIVLLICVVGVGVGADMGVVDDVVVVLGFVVVVGLGIVTVIVSCGAGDWV